MMQGREEAKPEKKGSEKQKILINYMKIRSMQPQTAAWASRNTSRCVNNRWCGHILLRSSRCRDGDSGTQRNNGS